MKKAGRIQQILEWGIAITVICVAVIVILRYGCQPKTETPGFSYPNSPQTLSDVAQFALVLPGRAERENRFGAGQEKETVLGKS